MKIVRLIAHPNILIASYLIIMISGEHLGGFYAMYLLMALPHGSYHSLAALFGILLVVISLRIFKRNPQYKLEQSLNILGLFFMLLSLFLFFYMDTNKYNYDTFYQTVPQVTLVLFGIVSLVFLFDNLVKFGSYRQKK